MKAETFNGLVIIACFLILGATIVGSFYVAYNPKACPPSEMHVGMEP